MARYHYWQFLVNQEGQPINNAEISIYLAGTDIPAYVYRSETEDDGIDEAPQTYSNKAGYFEFGLGDEEESDGYPIGTKFKLQGYREGIASGSIDGIDIFPGFAPVNESDSTSEFKNKLVSNALAYEGNEHAKGDVTVDNFPIHGITPVDEESTSTTFNKLVSNRLIHDIVNHQANAPDHKDMGISTSGILNGGGNLADDEIVIVLNNEDINHNYISGLQGGEIEERYHLSEDNHDNLTSNSPEFYNVILNGTPTSDNHAVRKDYVDDIAQGLFGQNSVIDFYDPSTSLPASASDGERHIASTDGNGGTEDYIYEYDSDLSNGVEIEPIQGYTLLVEEENRHYHYNGTEGIKFGAGFAGYKISSNTTLENRSGYLVDCSGSALTLTFPANPSMGNRIDVLDYTANSQTNNITLDGNGNSIEEQSEFTIDINGAGLQLVYTEEPYGGKVINEVYA